MNFSSEIRITDNFEKEFKFDDLKSLLTFLKVESSFWEEKSKEIKKDSNAPFTIFRPINDILKLIKDSFTGNFSSSDEFIEYLQNSNETKQGLSVEKHALIEDEVFRIMRDYESTFRSDFYYSKHPFISSYIDIVNRYNYSTAEDFIRIVVDDSFDGLSGLGSIDDIDTFRAAILAYEYSSPDSSLISRVKSEQISMEQLKDLFKSETSQAREIISSIKTDFDLWLNKRVLEYADIKETQEKERNDVLEKQKNIFSNYFDECKQKTTTLEETYSKKLMLEEPAMYWKKSAEKHQKNANFSSRILGAVSIGAIFLLAIFFSQWIYGNPTPLKLSSLQGAIIFGSLLAVLAFVLKVLSRIIFSSLHLSRDAEERQQLTYFYLSLTKSNKISENERELVLTSLFSRSESGLLTNDHGPTLPIADIIKISKGGKA